MRVGYDGTSTHKQQSPSTLIFIQSFINNISINTMIDTGSSISAIDSEFFKTLNCRQQIVPSSSSCKTANNTYLNVKGVVTLPINIADLVILLNIFVIDNLCAKLLLGGDFLEQCAVDISYSGKYLLINKNQRHRRVKFSQIHRNQQFTVTTIHDVSIPPFHSKVIHSTTSAPAMAAIFTPVSKVLNNHQVVSPHAILEVDKNGIATLTLLNTSSSIQIIPKGTKVGHIRCYHRSDSTHPILNQPLHHISTISSTPTSDVSTTKSIGGISNMVQHLSPDQGQRIYSILTKYKTVFDTSTPSVMNTNNIFHRIPVKSYHPPIQSYPYRKSIKETDIINQQVQEMLNNKVIRPSASPWSSPVVIIRKKDGSPRFCVDYRKLNLITERDLYPLPRIDDLVDRLAGSQYFSTLDLKAGYWQVPIAEQDKSKSAFVTTDGLFEFNVLPFGLSNAPATFQRIINSVLGSLRWDICLVYLDDIIIHSRSFDKHVQDLDLVLNALAKANVKLNMGKCTLARKQIDYLGFRITRDGIKPTTTNVRKTLDFPIPTSAKAAYSFIQMAQFYRRFIKDFASIATPLNVFKNKAAKFVWTDACQRSFDTLKQKLSQYPLLAFHDDQSTLKLKINTDACNTGIGGVLHKTTADGHTQPVQYLSRSLSKREQKYSVIEKECLAMVWCITKLRPYLYGRKFTLITDHHPLCWLNKQSSKNGRLDRWSLQLQEYSFDIKYTPGSSNCVADCLSRYPNDSPDDIVEQQLDLLHGQDNNQLAAMTPMFDSSEIRDEQQRDKSIKLLSDKLLAGTRLHSFVRNNDILHRLIYRPGGITLQVPYVPASMVPQLLHAYHDSPTAGHLGINKTWHKIRDRYYWPRMYKEVKQHVLSCSKCNQFKISRRKSTGTLQPIEPPTGTLDLMGLDFMGPLPPSSNGSKYILVCTDYLSRFAITQATSNCTAETAARFLIDKVILQYGVPKQLLTDRGSHFMANVFRAIASRCGITHITTTTYHPQCNGLTERFNATLVGSISAYVNQQQTDWDEYLSYVTFAYNTAQQSTTQIAPFKLMYGRDPTLPFDTPTPITKMSLVNDYYSQLCRFMEQAKSMARTNIKQQQNIYKRTYDTGRQDLSPLKPGRLVFIKQMMAKNLRKFSPKYYGPFSILQQLSRLNYEVQHVHDGHKEKVHVSRIRLI